MCIPCSPGSSPVTLTASWPRPPESEIVARPTLVPVESTRLALAVGSSSGRPSGPLAWPPHAATAPAITSAGKRLTYMCHSPVHRAAQLSLSPLVLSHGDGAPEDVAL